MILTLNVGVNTMLLMELIIICLVPSYLTQSLFHVFHPPNHLSNLPGTSLYYTGWAASQSSLLTSFSYVSAHRCQLVLQPSLGMLQEAFGPAFPLLFIHLTRRHTLWSDPEEWAPAMDGSEKQSALLLNLFLPYILLWKLTKMHQRLRNFATITHVTTIKTLMLLFYYKCFIASLSVHPSIPSCLSILL